MRIHRPISAPVRGSLTSEQAWRSGDRGLIACWERGRQRALQEPELAIQARAGRLMVLPWKGGVDRQVKRTKVGTLWYLAMWQGLRGEDLDIDLNEEPVLTCAVTGVRVLYTLDYDKYKNAR